MRIVVFSYNRGRYLHNCLDSLFRHAPQYPVTVMDDGSTDPAVDTALEAFGERIRVIRNDRASTAYLGGLYANMQQALDDRDGDDLALFIQDDQQIVRDLDERDEQHWKRFFAVHPEAVELATTFLKANRRPGSLNFHIDPEVPVYFRDDSVSRRAHFAATGLFHTARLREADWGFMPTEGENNQQARELGVRMGFTPYPFMMWLPNAESSKFRRKSLLHRFAEWYREVGFYPYEPMTPSEVKWLYERDLSKLPLAQEVLRPTGMKEDQQWLFEDATKSIRFIHRRLKRKKKKEAARARNKGRSHEERSGE